MDRRLPLLLAGLVAVARADDTAATMYVSSETTGQCASDAYFDTVTLACRDCSEMAADDATAAVLVGADFDAFGNARSCACPAGYAFVDGSAACSTDGACASVACAPCAEASYADGSACALCGDTTTGVDAATGDCGCADADAILVEVGHDGAYLESKACAACAAGRFAAWGDAWVAGAFYPGNPYACASCPDARMAWTGSACACAAGYDLVGEATVGAQSCVLSSQRDELEDRADVDDAGLVVYDAIQTQKGGDAEGYDAFDSAAFHHMFVNSSTRCLYHDGTASADAACQTLANLCVMTGYRLDAEACEFYEELRDERGDKHDEGAQESLPWLLYDADGETVRKDAGVQTPFAFTASARNRYHKLELRALAYALNGTFLGSEPFDADFFYCETQTPRTKFGGGANRGTKWTLFGHSWHSSAPSSRTATPTSTTSTGSSACPTSSSGSRSTRRPSPCASRGPRARSSSSRTSPGSAATTAGRP